MVIAAPELIFICRANRCRSPLAEHLARDKAYRLGLGVTVSSAGLLRPGELTPQVGIRAAAQAGIDLSAHRSRRANADQLARADLILTSGRAEARDLVAELPETWPRVHPLRQFLRWAHENPAPQGADFQAWVGQAAAGRSRTVLLGSSAADDIADPMGRPARAWRAAIGDLDRLIDQLLRSCSGALPELEAARR